MDESVVSCPIEDERHHSVIVSNKLKIELATIKSGLAKKGG